MVFLLMIIIDGFRYLFTKEKNKYSILIILLFTLMANELLEARWLYNTSYLNIIFWVFAGTVTYVYEKELQRRKMKKHAYLLMVHNHEKQVGGIIIFAR